LKDKSDGKPQTNQAIRLQIRDESVDMRNEKYRYNRSPIDQKENK